MAKRKLNKTTPKPSMLQNQRMKLKSLKLEAPPATVGPNMGEGAGRTGMPNVMDNILRNSLRLLAPFGLRRVPQIGGASAILSPTNTGDGTLTGAMNRGDYSPSQNMVDPNPTAPVSQKEKLSPSAQSFDRAFAKARAEGKATFKWRGRLYHTKYKEEM